MSSITNRLSDLVMLVAALEEKALRDEERIKDLLARNERVDAARDAAIVAAWNALPALLECASALEAFASDNFVSGSQMVEAVKKARAALDALAAQGETKT